MILSTRRNTSPRLAATWLTFMASAAALFAVTAICLAPRIVLAQRDAAPSAANTQGSVSDDPRTPAVASAAVSFSPQAGEAVSSDAAPSATPKPPAFGLGPKSKPGHSRAANSQPAVVPAPSTPALPAAPTANGAQSGESGDIFLKFFNAPIDQIFEKYSDLTGRTILRPASLQASITIISYPPLTRTEAIQALDGALAMNGIAMIPQGEKFVKAARAADLTKRAAVDAEQAARAEQKRQTKRNFKVGSQKQLDDLRKQLEKLDREREKLEHQIEELERNQEQLDQQGNEEQDSNAQSDTSEFNSDSIPTPRK